MERGKLDEPGRDEVLARIRGSTDFADVADADLLVEAVVDANEPPMPGHVTMKQALHFAKALASGQQREGWDIIKTVIKNTVREVV